MSIRQKILSASDTFLTGMSNNTLEAFGESFRDLFEQIQEGVSAGSLSLEDQQLAYKVAEMIQELGTGLDRVQRCCEKSQVDIQEQVDQAMAASILSASAFFNGWLFSSSASTSVHKVSRSNHLSSSSTPPRSSISIIVAIFPTRLCPYAGELL